MTDVIIDGFELIINIFLAGSGFFCAFLGGRVFRLHANVKLKPQEALIKFSLLLSYRNPAMLQIVFAQRVV